MGSAWALALCCCHWGHRSPPHFSFCIYPHSPPPPAKPRIHSGLRACQRYVPYGGQQVPSSDLVSIEIQGSDVSGRYLFAVPSAALRFISIIAAIFAMFVIFRRTTLLIGTIFTATAFAVGLLLATMLHDQGGTRKTLVAPIAKAAANASLTGARLEEYIESSVHLNGLFGITATFVVLCSLSVVAIRARDEELTPAILRQRLFDLRWSMILAAAVLALAVIITRSLVE